MYYIFPFIERANFLVKYNRQQIIYKTFPFRKLIIEAFTVKESRVYDLTIEFKAQKTNFLRKVYFQIQL